MEPTDVANVSKTKGITITRGVAPGFPVVIWMNTEAGPFADVRVRQAALYGYDRQTHLKSVYAGQYLPAYGPLSPVTWAYGKFVEKMYPYSPARAGALLDAAGWRMGSGGIREKNGQKLQVRFFDAADSRRGEYLQANLKKIGIDVVVRMVSFPDLFAVTRKASDYDMASTWFASSDPSILNVLFLSTNVEEGFAISRWKNKELDNMLMKGVSTVNNSKRAAIYAQIQRHVMKNALHIPMYSETEIDGLRAPFTGYKLERGQYPLLYGVR
jgi:peptide/nickel transport system substrate-binding protein